MCLSLLRGVEQANATQVVFAKTFTFRRELVQTLLFLLATAIIQRTE